MRISIAFGMLLHVLLHALFLFWVFYIVFLFCLREFASISQHVASFAKGETLV